jgi:hypothetical protein
MERADSARVIVSILARTESPRSSVYCITSSPFSRAASRSYCHTRSFNWDSLTWYGGRRIPSHDSHLTWELENPFTARRPQNDILRDLGLSLRFLFSNTREQAWVTFTINGRINVKSTHLIGSHQSRCAWICWASGLRSQASGLMGCLTTEDNPYTKNSTLPPGI